MKYKIILVSVLLFVSVTPIFPSGGYDHGTSTGKGRLELDFTWNPFDLIEFGQSYVVFGYGITDKLDIHGYYAHQTDRQDNYYGGVFYQFLNLKYLDLATASGVRQYTKSDVKDLFFPQLLFNLKLSRAFTVGGAVVDIQRFDGEQFKHKGTAIDVALYLPLSGSLNLPHYIHELELALGVFNPGVFNSDYGKYLPTYSINITFAKFGKKNK